nr:uncharacterized protein LOC125421044 [Ziziphus jujuba var. spinosa]
MATAGETFKHVGNGEEHMEEGHGESSSSSSSSDIGSNELPDQQNQPNSNHQDLITQTASSLLQAAGPLAIFESSGVPATIQHVGIPQLQQSNGAASHVLFPPSAVGWSHLSQKFNY